MAPRLSPKHDAKTREKIQTSQLVNRLMDHANGKVEMSPTQVRAAEILLNKTLPNLAAQDINLNGEMKTRTITDKPMDDDEWERRYGSSLATTGGATEGAH